MNVIRPIKWLKKCKSEALEVVDAVEVEEEVEGIEVVEDVKVIEVKELFRS